MKRTSNKVSPYRNFDCLAVTDIVRCFLIATWRGFNETARGIGIVTFRVFPLASLGVIFRLFVFSGVQGLLMSSQEISTEL